MKDKNKNLCQIPKTKTRLVCLVSVLVCSLLLQAKTLAYHEQESGEIPAKVPQSSIGNAPEPLWNKTWGGTANDTAMNIALDSSNNIYITGTWNITDVPPTSAMGESLGDIMGYQPPPSVETTGDIILLKFDSEGNYQWSKTWGSSGRNDGRAIAVDSSEHIYVLGMGAEDEIVFLKYDSSGVLQWDKTWISSGTGYALALDSEGNVFIAGSQSGDMVLWKFNSLGTLVWERTWDGGSESVSGWGVEVDSLNNIYVTGLTRILSINFDLYLVKYDTSGNLQWDTAWGGGGFDDAHSIAIDSSDNIFVAGCGMSFGAGGNDLSFVKFNSAGQLQWNKTWGGNESEGSWDILTLDHLDNVYLGSSTSSFGAGGSDGVLVKLNNSGEQLWNCTWGGAGDDGFSSLIVDSEENIFLTGATDSFGAGGDDMVLIKYSQTTNTTTNTTTDPTLNFRISGYYLLLPLGGLGLIVVISRKKWRFTAMP